MNDWEVGPCGDALIPAGYTQAPDDQSVAHRWAPRAAWAQSLTNALSPAAPASYIAEVGAELEAGMKVLFGMLAATALALSPLAAQAQDHGGDRGGRGEPAHAAQGGGYRSGAHGAYGGGQRYGGGASLGVRRGFYRAAPSGYSRFGAVNDRGFGDRRGGRAFADRRYEHDYGRERGFGRGFGVGFYGGYYPYDYAYDDGGYYPYDEGYDGGYAEPYSYDYADEDYGAAPYAGDYGADSGYENSYGGAGYYDAGPQGGDWSAGAPPADCGQWVWRSWRRQYQWVPAACGPCPPDQAYDDQ